MKDVNIFFDEIDNITINESNGSSDIIDIEDENFDFDCIQKTLQEDNITEEEIEEMFSSNKKKKNKKQQELDNVLVLKFVTNPTHENFNKLWERFYFGVKGHAYKFMHDWDMAADIACQTFTRAWEFQEKYDYNKAKFSTWLYTICRNLCLGEINNKKKDNYIETDISELYDSTLLTNSAVNTLDSTQYTVNGGNVTANNRDDIVTMMYNASINEINSIGGKFSEILTMKLVDNMKIREIADKLNMNESTVKNYLYKGKEIIHNRMINGHSNLCDMYLDLNAANE